MPLSLLRAATSLVGNRWAKPLIYVALAVLLIVGVGVVKCTYDNHIIEQHEAERDAIVERSARQASEGATAKSDTARSEEHTSELPYLMCSYYAFFCFKKNMNNNI